MRKQAISRGIMLIAGIFAVFSILLGQTFSQTSLKEKAKTETSDSSEKSGPTIQAPTEAIPATAVKVEQPSAPLVASVTEEETPVLRPVVRVQFVAKYLKVLLRTLIAPNAP